MLTLLLVDTELERVPQALTGHQQVIQAARRVGAAPGKMLLDSSLHHAAMRSAGLDDHQRRGRPDILHLFLLTALESIVNKAGQLRVLVHTRQDVLIRIEPQTRLVRNYNRFCGLMQQLLETGQVPPEQPLLRAERSRTPLDIVAELKPDRVVVMDETTDPSPPWTAFAPEDASRHVVCIIGGFPSGTFRSELPPGERVGFGPQQLTVWTVAAELLAHYGRAADVRLPPREPTPTLEQPPAGSGPAGPSASQPPRSARGSPPLNP